MESVEVIPLKVIPDARGRIFHFVRPDWFPFEVKEVYGSWIYPDAIKAWHLHTKMTLNYIVPVGNIKLVVHDGNGLFVPYFLGENCPHVLVRIPPGWWNGFVTVDGKPALVMNATDFVHSSDEIKRESPFCFGYDWYADVHG